ncbi:unnamed protein product [Gongylonema pulchrum]|uniref:Uncharacterized protein n=1 Tax=Gongylonema pulchrum TaxID=637853 RepID=A0A3P7RZP3_9BILA|nr:unnamed protein product [Gongylonema pulchrum]
MDLYVGGTIEDPFQGSVVGPTFACIIAEQFVRLRDGDSSLQIAALRRVTLASVLCDTGDDMPLLVPSALRSVHNQTLLPCTMIHTLDLKPWIERF